MRQVKPYFVKRNEGHDGAVLDPHFPILDCQHQLFDRPALRNMLDDYLERNPIRLRRTLPH